MAITIQNYEWRLNGQGAYVATDYPSAGNDLSLFISPFGNRIEIPPFVKEDEFVVIPFSVIVSFVCKASIKFIVIFLKCKTFFNYILKICFCQAPTETFFINYWFFPKYSSRVSSLPSASASAARASSAFL